LDTSSEIVAVGSAGAALIAAAGNAVALIIKAINDRRVNTAMSTDIVKLARNGGNTDPSTLHTPQLVPPAEVPPAHPDAANVPPAGPPG